MARDSLCQNISLLEKAHENDCDFVRFITEQVKETQRDYLRLLGA